MGEITGMVMETKIVHYKYEYQPKIHRWKMILSN